jgi:large subunit ribosomal protein L22
MIARATAKYIRMSPQKARLVVDLIRGKDANTAKLTLQFSPKRAAVPILKVLDSAIANAQEKTETIDLDDLFVERAYVDEGPRLKRIRPAPMGRAFRYQRRMSHVTIELGAKE